MSIASLLLECEPLNEGHGTARKIAAGTRDEGEIPEEVISDGSKSLYITGMEQAQDSRNIILFKDGERILSIRTGDLEEVGTGNDQHHFLNGHIYTEYNSSTGTVIKKDGKEFIRYDGCEVLRGMLSYEGSIYTLGQNRKGEGFSLRVDGDVIFESGSGRVWGDMLDVTAYPSGALYETDGNIIFCYYRSNDDQNSQNGVRQWYMVRNGIQTQLMIPNNITEIYDLRIIGGRVCMVGCLGTSTYPVLLVDGDTYNMNNSSMTTMKDFRLAEFEGEPVFYGTIIENGNTYKTGIWTQRGLKYAYEGKNDIIYEYRGLYSYVIYRDGTISLNFPWNRYEVLEGTYHFITCWNLALDGPDVHLVANPVDKSQNPILWSNGEISEFGQNIFLTSVCVSD